MMSNNAKIILPEDYLIFGYEMQVGDIALVVHCNGANAGRVVARRWDDDDDSAQIVDIANPRSTWTDPDFKVRVLKPGESVVIEIGKG